MEQKFMNNSFIQGIVVGVVVVGLLGGVYMLGARNGGGLLLGGGNTVTPTPTQPVAPDPNQPTLGTVKPISKDDYIVGKANAKIVLLEYSDLECPYCKNFHPTMKQIVDTYGDKVAWVYRHFPLSFHPNAQKLAEGAECAAELGGNDKFWQYVDKVYESMPGVTAASAGTLAEGVGINKAQFETCLNSGKYAGKVNQDLQEGQTAGITGTPGTIIIVDGKPQSIIPGALPFASIKATIDGLL